MGVVTSMSKKEKRKKREQNVRSRGGVERGPSE